MNESNEILSWRVARAITEELASAGITAVVISPGYRNAPLILAAHQNAELKVYPVVDERGAGFLALGLVKSGVPTAVFCTSGTAVANFHPAVMEASHSNISLVVITADRPLELIGTGANQCTNQNNIFGEHTRFFAEVSGGEPGFDAENHARYSVGKAVSLSRAPLAGPVHLNVRFREPFLASAAEIEATRSQPLTLALKWKFVPSASGPSKEQWDALETTLMTAKRPLIVIGANGFSESILASIFSLSEKTGIPILAENASGLPFRSGRYGGYISRHVESILAAMNKESLLGPDLFIRFGAPLTGKGLGSHLKKFSVPQIIFDEAKEAREPHLHPSICIQGGMEGWLAAFLRSSIQCNDQSWRDSLLAWGEKVEEKITAHLKEGSLTEWFFHRELSQKISNGCNLFLGNSMPIRDFNEIFHAPGKHIHVHSNRGLSGIDGLIASSAGIAIGSGQETHAVIGDLSTLHDLPSLSILHSFKEKLNLTLWVMNNGGGEIFKTVPTAAAGSADWFTTPQSFDLASLAKAFQIPFARITSRDQWADLPAELSQSKGARMIEILVNAETNLSVRQSFRLEG